MQIDSTVKLGFSDVSFHNLCAVFEVSVQTQLFSFFSKLIFLFKFYEDNFECKAKLRIVSGKISLIKIYGARQDLEER